MDAQATSALDRKVRRRWDWDLFDTHSHVWRKEIEREQRKREAAVKRGEDMQRVKWLFVDLYEMSLQRPDAHGAPGRDCLHCEFALFFQLLHFPFSFWIYRCTDVLDFYFRVPTGGV
jgi:hypothetical protein